MKYRILGVSIIPKLIKNRGFNIRTYAGRLVFNKWLDKNIKTSSLDYFSVRVCF